jgi:hypothetical protein
MNAMWPPFGDHDGNQSPRHASGWQVAADRFVRPVPFGWILKI